MSVHAPGDETEHLRYAEDFGILFQGFGGGRMAGRVLGALLVSGDTPGPTGGDFAARLGASRGAISAATGELERTGMIRRLRRPGERRDRFRLERGAWREFATRRAAFAASFREMAERGPALAEPVGPEAKRTLEEMRDFHARLEEETAALLSRAYGEHHGNPTDERRSWRS